MNLTVETLKTRLDKFLAENTSESRSKIQKDIEAGLVFVNGEAVAESKHVVRNGDSVTYEPSVEAELEIKDLPVKTIYEGRGLLIVDKPAGLSVHPGAGFKGDSLTQMLLFRYPDIANVGEAHRPGIVHRLDKDTSGCMLVALTPEMYEYLKRSFQTRKVKKEYIALVLGAPAKPHGFINVPIGRSKTDFRKYTTEDMLEPKEALTEYRVLETFDFTRDASVRRSLGEGRIDKWALISVNLHTGRTHQIRVHMASIGHPLAGDTLYGAKKAQLPGLDRQFLHAKRIEVQLPDDTWIEAESDLAPDLKEVLVNLGSTTVNKL